MTEYDLFDAIGEIDSSFVKNAAKPPFPLTDVSLAKGRLIHNKKITFAMIAATLALVLCGGTHCLVDSATGLGRSPPNILELISGNDIL